MNVIIFGASGRTGLELVRQSLQSGYKVTAFVRQRVQLDKFRDKNLTVIEGDLSNTKQVREAVSGKDAVISALGVSKTLHHDQKVIEGLATIAKVMKEQGISPCIYLSVFLAYSKPGQFSFFANNILKRIIGKEVSDHEVKEKLIRDQVQQYIIVRSARLTNKPLTKRYRHGENLVMRTFLPSISRADVAHFMLQQLIASEYNNKAVLLTGS